ncbi:MAG: hypothetical protein IT429_25580 [Gemmataceae bacterium]|nr:hypothetical protein [Gemmataceae bacterium]
MLRGEMTTCSALTPEALTATLQAHGVERLRGEAEVWVIRDGSDPRKPHAAAMAHLQRVKPLAGRTVVNGDRPLTALGAGRGGRRGLLYHRRFSSTAPDVVSESAETRRAIASATAALASLGADTPRLLAAGFDDVALWSAIWAQASHLLCRLQHRDR